MYPPSERQVIKDMEILIHGLLDAWLYGKKLRFDGKALPNSVIQRIKNELENGKLEGYFKEGI